MEFDTAAWADIWKGIALWHVAIKLFTGYPQFVNKVIPSYCLTFSFSHSKTFLNICVLSG